MAEFIPTLFPLLVRYARDSSPDIRQNSLYGLGVLAAAGKVNSEINNQVLVPISKKKKKNQVVFSFLISEKYNRVLVPNFYNYQVSRSFDS